MLIKVVLLALFASLYSSAELPTLYEYYTKGGIKSGLKADGDDFHLNGKPLTILSGSFHPFRVHQNKWRETLLKFKAAGLNTVQFYTAWNLHEETPGHFDFETGMLNVSHFLSLIKEMDMFAVFRPGPYICAEWEFGGFPAWLLRDPNMKLRSNYKPYLEAVDKYWSKLLSIANKFQFTDGGPIIAMQIENEFGNYGNTGDHNNAEYLSTLKSIATRNGMKELFFTCDNFVAKSGSLPGFYQSINFNRNAVQQLKAQKAMNPHNPLYVSEFWSGWFDAWMGGHSRWSTNDYTKQLEGILLEMHSSVNMYMFIGGTNFGFMAAHNLVTSYDYDAPLTESGNYTEKYYKTKEVIERLTKERNLPQIRKPVPPKVENAAHYGVVKVTEQLTMVDFLKHIKGYNVDTPINSELLPIGQNYGQNFGFTLYRTTIPKSTSMTFSKGQFKDRAFLMVDGNEQSTNLYPTSKPMPVNFDSKVFTKSGNEHTLDILVENMGRDNFGGGLNSQRKWLSEDILIDNKVHKKWQMFPLDFKPDFIQKVRSDKWSPVQPYKTPALYRGKLEIKDEPKDTYLRLDGWHATFVFINGFNVGRYWNNGPQKALYIPSPLLKKGSNEIIMFETYASGSQVEFVDRPDLG